MQAFFFQHRTAVLQLGILAVVLYLPILHISLAQFLGSGQAVSVDLFWGNTLDTYVRYLQYYSPIYLIIWLAREKLTTYGLHSVKPIKTALEGVTYFLFAIFAMGISVLIIEAIAPKSSLSLPQASSSDVYKLLFMFPLLFWGAMSEELIFRSFLHEKIMVLVKSRVVTVVLVAVLFSALHLYEGFEASVVLFVMSVVLSIYYCRHKNIIVPIGIHFVRNAIIVIAPLFTSH